MVRVLSIQPQKERMGIDRDVEKQTDGMWGCPEKGNRDVKYYCRSIML